MAWIRIVGLLTFFAACLHIQVSHANDKYNCNGDVMKLNPTGSKQTITEGGKTVTGVLASQQRIETDLSDLNGMKDCYYKIGEENCIHPAVIAALASRETRGGRLIRKQNGWGDYNKTRCNGYCAYGILQCDVKASGLGRDGCTKYSWDSCEHLSMMVKQVFMVKIQQVKKEHGGKKEWPPEKLLQGGIAAYNFGAGNVHNPDHRLDIGSAHGDYSNDVVARAQHLIRKHNWGRTTGDSVPPPAGSCDLRALAEAGDCGFYECIEKDLNCGQDGYPLGYGHKYCTRFGQYRNLFNEDGLRWMNNVRKCLMKELLSYHGNIGKTCETVKEFAFKSHPSCYITSEPGICLVALQPSNWDGFLKVYEFEDFFGEDWEYAIIQVMETVASCAHRQAKSLIDKGKDLYDNLKGNIKSFRQKMRELFKDAKVTPTKTSESSCEEYALNGDCRFYECFDQRFPCRDTIRSGQLIHFEMISCKELTRKAGYSSKEKQFVSDYQTCLMKAVMPLYKSTGVQCSSLFDEISDIRAECLESAGICRTRDLDMLLYRGLDLGGYPSIVPDRMERLSLAKREIPVPMFYFRHVTILRETIADVMCKCRAGPDGTCSPLYTLVENKATGSIHFVRSEKLSGYDDSACTAAAGTCRLTSQPCVGTFQPGQCGGPRNRQCCVSGDGDRPCVSATGVCKLTSETCHGEFTTKLCAGPTNRQCCLPGRGDTRCISAGGSCKFKDVGCAGGNFRERLCAGPSDRQCCVPLPPTPPPSTGSHQQICEGNNNNLIRNKDPQGAGWWHASRGGRLHEGIDIVCAAGSKVYAPISGKLIRNSPYRSPSEKQKCVNHGVQIGDRSGTAVSLWYVNANSSMINTVVNVGDVVGTHIGLHCAYSSSMTDHVHVTLWKKHKKADPTSELGGTDPR